MPYAGDALDPRYGFVPSKALSLALSLTPLELESVSEPESDSES